MLKIQVEYAPLVRMRDKYNRFAKGKIAKVILAEEIRDLGNDCLNLTKGEVPVRTGALQEHVIIEHKDFGFEIKDTMWYGLFVREGTAPHWIIAGLQATPSWMPEPVRGRNQSGTYFDDDRGWPKKYLAWEGSSGYVPYVFVSGIKPNNYQERAIEKIEQRVESFKKKYVARIITELTSDISTAQQRYIDAGE